MLGARGRFHVTNVRPGKYTLRAIADGVLGEFSKADVVVEAGKPLDLGSLEWKPVRYGRQLWESRLPAGGQATPMSYRSKQSGRQFLVVVAGGHGSLGTRTGDAIIAYALPSS